jgi:hypothetical protein
MDGFAYDSMEPLDFSRIHTGNEENADPNTNPLFRRKNTGKSGLKEKSLLSEASKTKKTLGTEVNSYFSQVMLQQ